MIGWWILGILLFMVLLLCLTRVGVLIRFGEELTVSARFGFLKFQVLPEKKKPLMESILAVPDLLAKGKCLTTEVSTIRVKVPYREGISPPRCGRENMEKYMVENAIPLIR